MGQPNFQEIRLILPKDPAFLSDEAVLKTAETVLKDFDLEYLDKLCDEVDQNRRYLQEELWRVFVERGEQEEIDLVAGELIEQWTYEE